ncbi:MAG: tetratricopeptide repeat protein [Nitrospira sp.]|nr:tetratricopeptide repeat protein [Nitrospira sp.]
MTPTQDALKTPYSILQISLLLIVALVFWAAEPALAEVRTITATGEYRMGDNDSRTDAKRLALLDAKRLALEQVGVYIESVTEVKNFDLTKEEIRAYTAGIVEVVEQATRTMLEGDTTVVRVDVKTKIDTDVVARQIDALRKNEDVRTKLLRAESDALQLRKELEAKTHELAAAKSRTNIEEIAQQRKALVARIESDKLATQASLTLFAASRYNYPLVDVHKSVRNLLDRALRLNPKNPLAHSLMGDLLASEGRQEESVGSYRAAVSLEPDSAQAHWHLGIALQGSKDWAGATKEFSIAIQKDPDFALAYNFLGMAIAVDVSMNRVLPQEEKQRVYDYAVTLVRKAIKLDPSDASYHVSLGNLLDRYKGDIEAGLAEIRTAVRLDPQYPYAQTELGRMLEKMGDREGAIAAYRVATQFRIVALKAQRALAYMLHESGSIEEAVAEYRELIRLDLLQDPLDPSWAAADHMQFGRFCEGMGLLEEAIRQYRAAFKFYDDHDRAFVLIRALAKSWKKQEASHVLREFLKRHPDDGQILKRDLKEDGFQLLDSE